MQQELDVVKKTTSEPCSQSAPAVSDRLCSLRLQLLSTTPSTPAPRSSATPNWTLNRDYEWEQGHSPDYGLFAIAGFLLPDGGLPEGEDGGTWAPNAMTDLTQPAPSLFAAIADAGLISQSQLAQSLDGG